jgi:hypothetical protein
VPTQPGATVVGVVVGGGLAVVGVVSGGWAVVGGVVVGGVVVVSASVVGVVCPCPPRRVVRTASRLARCVVLATATDPVVATKSKTAMNQTACKRFIRASPSVRGGCHVEWLSALPASVLDVVAEDWPEVRQTTVDVGLCQ